MSIDLDFRPESYWSPDSLLRSLRGNISGTWRRQRVRDVFDNGGTSPLIQPLLDDQLSARDRSSLGRIHPSLMGGEYLPRFKPGEVEIARIELKSVTADVISIRARPTSAKIYYRVVDEYDTVFNCRPVWSKHPLAFGQLVGLIDGTKGMSDAGGGLVFEILNAHVENSLSIEDCEEFIRLESVHYTKLESYYENAIEKWAQNKRMEVAS